MKRYFLPVIIVVLAFFAFKMMSGMKPEKRRRPPAEFVRTVSARPVAFGEIQPVIKTNGRVRSREIVSLIPEVSGVVLDNGFRLRKGASFTRDQILIQLDSRQTSYSLQSTIADLQNAFTSLLPNLKADIPEAYDRWSKYFDSLTENNLPELPSPETQREKLFVTRYNIMKLYYAAKSQRVALSKHTLRAPFTGTVVEASIYPASMARAGVSVATLARTDEMEIECALDEQAALMISPGAKANVGYDGAEEPVSGVVHRVGDALDERMQTVPVFIRVDRARRNGLKVGTYADVEIEGDPLPSAVVVPRKAIHDKSKVYIIEKQKLAEKPIEIAYVDLENAYILGGIAEGDIVITEPVQDAVIGMSVQTVEQARERAKSRAAGMDKRSPGGAK